MTGSRIKAEVNVEVGKKSVDKLVDAVIDVFSPGTELLGALGDAVRLGRVEMAAKITRRAGEIASENGMALRTPPLKFLVPFYEKASLEDEQDDTLTERWANLLVSSSSSNMGNSIIYSNILASLCKDHIMLLSGMMQMIKFPPSCRTEGILFPPIEVYLNSKLVAIDLSACTSKRDARDAFTEMSGSCLSRACYLESALLRSTDLSRESHEFNSTMSADGLDISIQRASYLNRDTERDTNFSRQSLCLTSLKSCGILDVCATETPTSYFQLASRIWHFTPFGFAFWCACNGFNTNRLAF